MRFRRDLALSLAFFMLACIAGCGGGDQNESTPGEGSAISPPAEGPVAAAPTIEMHPTVVLETSLGAVTLRLDREHAPLTVDNFLDYVATGHYDGAIFHMVDQGYVVLGGGYTEDLEEKPAGVAIRNEAHNGLQNKRGTIAMARSTEFIDSSTCQFFINLADNDALDHQGRSVEEYGYCVFGEVIDGLDIVDNIAGVPVEASGEFEKLPRQAVLINSARRLR